MSKFVEVFVALHGFLRRNRGDTRGVRVIIEVDGDMETERLCASIHDDAGAYTYTASSKGVELLRTGTAMGIPFEIRRSPRCPACHK